MGLCTVWRLRAATAAHLGIFELSRVATSQSTSQKQVPRSSCGHKFLTALCRQLCGELKKGSALTSPWDCELRRSRDAFRCVISGVVARPIPADQAQASDLGR